MAANRPRDAVGVFERALAYSSRSDEAYFRTAYGHALLVLGEPARAARELERPTPWPAQYLRAAPTGSAARAAADSVFD